MYARVTQFEIDTVQISPSRALERFNELVLPELRGQPGFEGLAILQSPGGRGMLISFWHSREAEQASRDTGYYDDQVRKFLTFYRQPPGLEAFEVTYLDMQRLAPAGGPL